MTTPKRHRPRGEGSIYRTAAGRWRGALVVTDPDDGTRRRRVVSGRTQAEVRERMAELKRNVAAGAKPGDPRTLAAYVETWLPALRQRVRPASYRAHERDLRLHVLPVLGSIPLAALTPTGVERMTAGMIAQGLSPTTARGARTVLRLVLRDAERDGLVTRNVAALARPPRVERHVFTILTADETRKLIEGTADDELGPVFVVAAVSGMRQGEILGLRWEDVDLDGATLTVARAITRGGDGGLVLTEPKTARSRRTLDLAPVAVGALRRQKARQEADRLAHAAIWQDVHGLVFTDQIGRPLWGSHVSAGLTAALARLGLPHIRFHDLRHGAASMMLSAGLPLQVVSETLGHSGISITADVYGHLDRGQRRQAAEVMERAIGGGS